MSFKCQMLNFFVTNIWIIKGPAGFSSFYFLYSLNNFCIHVFSLSFWDMCDLRTFFTEMNLTEGENGILSLLDEYAFI